MEVSGPPHALAVFPRDPLDMRLDGTWYRSGRCGGEQNISCPDWESNAVVQPAAWSLYLLS
jgi:hypothetical protein